MRIPTWNIYPLYHGGHPSAADLKTSKEHGLPERNMKLLTWNVCTRIRAATLLPLLEIWKEAEQAFK